MKADLLAKNIRLCQKGLPEGFTWLLKQYAPRLFGYFLQRSGSALEAEELLQELSLRLVKNIARYRHRDRFESWLFRIAANLARDRVRRQRHAVATVSLAAGSDDVPGPGETLAADEPSPVEKLIKGEQLDRVHEALKQLPDLDRELILLRHYGQLSFREIAEHFDMPLGTALAKVHRGLKQVRKLLGEES